VEEVTGDDLARRLAKRVGEGIRERDRALRCRRCLRGGTPASSANLDQAADDLYCAT
jgi:hypothetical protein